MQVNVEFKGTHSSRRLEEGQFRMSSDGSIALVVFGNVVVLRNGDSDDVPFMDFPDDCVMDYTERAETIIRNYPHVVNAKVVVE